MANSDKSNPDNKQLKDINKSINKTNEVLKKMSTTLSNIEKANNKLLSQPKSTTSKTNDSEYLHEFKGSKSKIDSYFEKLLKNSNVQRLAESKGKLDELQKFIEESKQLFYKQLELERKNPNIKDGRISAFKTSGMQNVLDEFNKSINSFMSTNLYLGKAPDKPITVDAKRHFGGESSIDSKLFATKFGSGIFNVSGEDSLLIKEKEKVLKAYQQQAKVVEASVKSTEDFEARLEPIRTGLIDNLSKLSKYSENLMRVMEKNTKPVIYLGLRLQGIHNTLRAVNLPNKLVKMGNTLANAEKALRDVADTAKNNKNTFGNASGSASNVTEPTLDKKRARNELRGGSFEEQEGKNVELGKQKGFIALLIPALAKLLKKTPIWDAIKLLLLKLGKNHPILAGTMMTIGPAVIASILGKKLLGEIKGNKISTITFNYKVTTKNKKSVGSTLDNTLIDIKDKEARRSATDRLYGRKINQQRTKIGGLNNLIDGTEELKKNVVKNDIASIYKEGKSLHTMHAANPDVLYGLTPSKQKRLGELHGKVANYTHAQNTAKVNIIEAEKTIQSLKKSSNSFWRNVGVELTRSGRQATRSIKNLGKTFVTVFGNMRSTVKKFFTRTGGTIKNIITYPVRNKAVLGRAVGKFPLNYLKAIGNTIIKPHKAIGSAMRLATPMLGKVASTLAGPWGMVLIPLIVGAAKPLAKGFISGFMEPLKNIKTDVGKIFGGLGSAFRLIIGLFDGLWKVCVWLGKVLGHLLHPLAKLAGIIGGAFVKSVVSVWGWIGSAITKLEEILKGIAESDAIKTLQNVWKSIGDGFNTLMQKYPKLAEWFGFSDSKETEKGNSTAGNPSGTATSGMSTPADKPTYGSTAPPKVYSTNHIQTVATQELGLKGATFYKNQGYKYGKIGKANAGRMKELDEFLYKNGVRYTVTSTMDGGSHKDGARSHYAGNKIDLVASSYGKFGNAEALNKALKAQGFWGGNGAIGYHPDSDGKGYHYDLSFLEGNRLPDHGKASVGVGTGYSPVITNNPIEELASNGLRKSLDALTGPTHAQRESRAQRLIFSAVDVTGSLGVWGITQQNNTGRSKAVI